MTDEEILPPVSVLVLRDYVIKELPIDNSNEEQTKYLFEISQSTGKTFIHKTHDLNVI